MILSNWLQKWYSNVLLKWQKRENIFRHNRKVFRKIEAIVGEPVMDEDRKGPAERQSKLHHQSRWATAGRRTKQRHVATTVGTISRRAWREIGPTEWWTVAESDEIGIENETTLRSGRTGGLGVRRWIMAFRDWWAWVDRWTLSASAAVASFSQHRMQRRLQTARQRLHLSSSICISR